MNQKPDNSGYEKQDVSVRPVIIVAIATILIVSISAILLNEYFVVTTEELIFEAVLEPESPDLIELRASEQVELTTYQLIDTSENRWRIPVDSAIRLLIEEAEIDLPKRTKYDSLAMPKEMNFY